ncbi:MAG: hypothetical protein U5L45_25200 [Saprospiraceae bacterium]|nr:hypothetical protein [Saprospiraceae bacterium]
MWEEAVDCPTESWEKPRIRLVGIFVGDYAALGTEQTLFGRYAVRRTPILTASENI